MFTLKQILNARKKNTKTKSKGNLRQRRTQNKMRREQQLLNAQIEQNLNNYVDTNKLKGIRPVKIIPKPRTKSRIPQVQQSVKQNNIQSLQKPTPKPTPKPRGARPARRKTPFSQPNISLNN